MQRKRTWVIRMQKYLANPVTRRLARFIPSQALIETTGRRSGQPRRTPVGGSFEEGCFWVVSEHGRHAQYVRNLLADPRVRVFADGRWHTGTAEVLPEDDPHARLRRLPAANSAVVRALGTDLLTIKITITG